MPQTFNPLPDMWNSPAEIWPGSSMYDSLEELLTLDNAPVHQYGSSIQVPSFNCLAWALGITNQVMTPGVVNGSMPDFVVRNLMTQYGMSEVDEGSSEANIIAWGYGSSVLHFSVLVQFPNELSWSSKLGFSANSEYPANSTLMAHALTAPEGQAYGSPLIWFHNPNGI